MGLTYDALGRMVEQNRSGAYTQIVYGPLGNKLALMNGQTLSKAFVGLPGGATAVYTSSGLSYYRHSDWLGSSRLDSGSSRTVTYQVAYGPYGEPYDESGTTDRNFTGQNADTVGDMYDFPSREYHWMQGRWIEPDPAGLAAVNPTNPQSWNRYAYVVNNPTRLIDPLGLFRRVPEGCTVVGYNYGDPADPILDCNPTADGLPGMQQPTAPGDRGSTPPRDRVILPFSLDKYNECCEKAFGNTQGRFSVAGANYNLSFAATTFIAMASEVTGEPAATIAGTYLIESGGGNLNPINNQNQNGSVDIGPMQLNYTPGPARWSSVALGTNLAGGLRFNGNSWVNIVEGAAYLNTLNDPGNYVGSNAGAVQNRDGLLNRLAEELNQFLDCLHKP